MSRMYVHARSYVSLYINVLTSTYAAIIFYFLFEHISHEYEAKLHMNKISVGRHLYLA